MMRINELVLPADDTVSCEWFSSHCDVCHVWSSTSSCLNNAIPAVGHAFPMMGSEVLGVKEFDQADLPSPYASGAVLKHPPVWGRKEQNGILPPPRLR